MTEYRVVVKKFGKIKNEDLNYILNIIHICYKKSERKPSIVDLYVFEKQSQMINFMRYISDGIDNMYLWSAEKYYATHDAWTGIPRIMIAIHSINKLPKKVVAGAIMHEVAHSILHGELKYYIITCPAVLRQKFNKDIARQIVYLLSVAVKDYEVTRFLLRLGFIDEQIDFIRYLLKPTIEEKEEYTLSKISSEAEKIAIASILKTLMCALPLAKINEDIRSELENYIRNLLPEHKSIIEEILSNFENKIEKILNFDEKIKIFSEIFVNSLQGYS